ncbi:MAG TPA: hypothetical protein VH684_27995 [Xanthobacteraceae bacterium]|jgi:hypothetical protein
MGWRLILSIIGIGISTLSLAGEPYVHSNDTGGIISWSCEAEAEARSIAAYECGRFGKYPRITSVHRRYGDYIGFQCLWNPNIAFYQIPPVRTRSSCAAHVHRYGRVVKALD